MCHLRVAGTAGTDVTVRWTRRTRLEGDSWSQVEVPLAEDAEAYIVRVLSGAAIVAEYQESAPSFSYPAAAQAADGLTGAFGLAVAQVSARFGPAPSAGSISASDMLRPLPAELLLLARALTAVPAPARAGAARRWLAEAAEADKFRHTANSAHPDYGDGSLAARLGKLALPPLCHGDDPEFLSSLRIAADAVLTHTAP